MERKSLKIANLPRQVLILMGKNFIMFRRNIVGTLVEIICPILFLLILFIMRYFVEKIVYPQQFNLPRSFQTLQSSQTRNLVLFYPNNTLIQSLVNKTVQSLAEYNFEFTPTSIFFSFICINVSNTHTQS